MVAVYTVSMLMMSLCWPLPEMSHAGVLMSPWPHQEGNKLMFLSEWREFSPAPCLAGKET